MKEFTELQKDSAQKAEKKETDLRKAKALKQAGIEPGFGMQG